MKRSLKTAAVCELTVHLHLRNKALLGHHSKSKSRNEETEARKRESGRESTKPPGEITKIRSVMETLTRETKSPLKRSSKDEEEKATLTCAIDNNMMGSVQQAASTAIRRGFMVTVYLAVRSATHLSCQAGASLPTASFSPRRAR